MQKFIEYLSEAENSALKEYVGYVVNSLYSGDYEFSSAKGGMIKPAFSGNKSTAFSKVQTYSVDS